MKEAKKGDLVDFLRFTRHGTTVMVSAYSCLPVPRSIYNFDAPAHEEILAELLVGHLRSTFGRLVSEARREAYEQGYVDGRNHHSKKRAFQTGLKVEVV